MVGQGVGPCPCDVFVLEATDAVELRFVQPIEQVLEFRLGLTRVADDEGRAQGDVGADVAPCGDFVERFGAAAGRAMRFRTSGWRAGTGCRGRAAADDGSAMSGIRSRTWG